MICGQRDARAVEGRPVDELIAVDPATGLAVLPHWVAQPYVRALPKVAAEDDKNSAKAEAVVAQGGTPAPAPGESPVTYGEMTRKAFR